MRDFKKLDVWVKSHQLVLDVYRETQAFPAEERYGLTSQIRRAATSIPANIAEGCGKNTEAELARYLTISMGSASELEYHLLLAKDLEFLTGERYQDLTDNLLHIKRMLVSFTKRLRNG
jgi:four helix bundle protein